jgi:UDP-N-acetylglucosamine--N-acetylmuramyl-(pentapeptide) pyrophosphoryl-undecaprenol N-acetylglucosamine transferase
MGGFVSGPGGVAAWLTRRPLVIHEQNAAAGMTNRLLARLARVVLQAFPGSFNSDVDVETVGNPVREDIAAVASPHERYANRQGVLRVLVLGGSQGALALNRTVPAALAILEPEVRPVIRHQCGERTLEIAKRSYDEHEVDVDLLPFIEDMAAAYAWADLVICRAGALTVAELCAVGVPALFVPYPAAVDDHQTANALPMVEAGAAMIVPESELTPERLAGLLREWLQSRAALQQRAAKARALARPDSLRRITEICLEQAGGAVA